MTVPDDRIAIIGIKAVGHHGVFAHERRDGQEFVVDLELAVDLTAAAASDDLADTVDYGAVAALAVEVVTGEPRDLIEKVAVELADRVLADERVSQVTVTLHKPQAPVGVPFDDVLVRVTRGR